jgi:TPR repeat protein
LKGHDAFKKKNWKSAFALYEGVEDKYQDPILCVRIGLILERGMGVKRDSEKAAQLFATALPLVCEIE